MRNFKYVIYDKEGYLDEESGFPSYRMAENKAIKICINMIHNSKKNNESIYVNYKIEEVK